MVSPELAQVHADIRRGKIIGTTVAAVALAAVSASAYIFWPSNAPPKPSYSSSPFQYTVASNASVTYACTTLANGGYSCGPSDDYYYLDAVRSQIPIEAQDAKEPREAFRKWVMTLDDSKAKTTYLRILDQYDQQEKLEQEQKVAAEKRQKELLVDVPRATCKRLASLTTDGTVKGGSYKCEPARAADLKVK